MIFYEQPNEKWTRFDFLLLEAYQILQDETCPQCGQPVWLCRSTDPNVNIKVRKASCFVTAEVEKKKTRDEKNKRGLKPGEYYYPVIETIQKNTELPSRRDYYESLADS